MYETRASQNSVRRLLVPHWTSPPCRDLMLEYIGPYSAHVNSTSSPPPTVFRSSITNIFGRLYSQSSLGRLQQSPLAPNFEKVLVPFYMKPPFTKAQTGLPEMMQRQPSLHEYERAQYITYIRGLKGNLILPHSREAEKATGGSYYFGDVYDQTVSSRAPEWEIDS